MKSTVRNKISYEPEADVLSLEIGGKDIDHAEEIDGLVVHYGKSNDPVLIGILNASELIKRANKLIAETS
jgi:hypothetical protein